ncbi:MAG: DUF7678 domain-containing protein [Saccharofermentanales bacterium]|jgi:hypothetical protein|nr:MAG TPA: hypothetical protein [Caudoviricetes sp.]
MWKEGTIGIPKEDGGYTACKYWLKHFDKPSVYGIDRGRISKLMLKIDGEVVCNFDRGWDIRPTSEDAEKALVILLHEYN